MRVALAISALAISSAAFGQSVPPDSRVAFFEKKVRPILVNHCYICHSADTNSKGGLRVDDRNGLVNGGKSGPAIVPGDPAKSLLIQRVTLKNIKRRMPAEGKELTADEIGDLRTWIQDGAAWPVAKLPASLGKSKAEYAKLRKEHWAWQPLTNPSPPAVRDAAWPHDDIDRLILAKLEAKNMHPVGDADQATLLRRLTFDLTGLPPTPEQMHENLPYEQLVDRLLSSPQFGERWGRHWLDVARYGESTGPSRNIPYPHAWKYRDYVIDSVNADVPFNRFVQEQIAGDLLPASTHAERDRLLIATGFLALGVKDVNQRFKVRFIMDNVDEQIDAVSRSILALTVTCARCHDHKFDPIPTTDYYALAGIFTSTDNCAGVRNKMGGGGLDYYDPSMLLPLSTTPPPPPPEKVAKLKAEVAEAKKAWDKIRGTPEGLKLAANGQPTQRPFRLKYERLQAELAALNDPASRGYAVHGVREAKKIADTEVRIRGQAEKLGPKVPRGFLTAFEVPGAAKIEPRHSGRLELAQWLTSEKNPLTARVIVNRVWEHLFGRGIVSTVDNFGVNGDEPSDAELLDHLANRFMDDGWSIKKLIRRIVLTRAYQLSSDAPAELRAVDPDNKRIWRHSPRRLDTEEIRDATLLAAGSLDLSRPGPSPATDLKMVEMSDNGPEARTINDKADRTTHRSVYLPLLRGVTPHSLEAFDPVEQSLVTGKRDATTVPAQSLFMLNSSFVRHQALVFAASLLRKADESDIVGIEAAYERALSRRPTNKEINRARAFLGEYESSYRQEPAPTQPTAVVPKKNKPGPAGPANATHPKDARTAAWMAFVQALYASAEFRFVR